MSKVARVSQVNLAQGTVRAVIVEDGTVTNWLPLTSSSYEIPAVGDLVMVDFEDGDFSGGLCLGRYFNSENPPAVEEAGVYFKKIGSDVVIKYTEATKTLEVFAETIKINGNVEVTGDLKVSGEITAPTITQGG